MGLENGGSFPTSGPRLDSLSIADYSRLATMVNTHKRTPLRAWVNIALGLSSVEITSKKPVPLLKWFEKQQKKSKMSC